DQVGQASDQQQVAGKRRQDGKAGQGALRDAVPDRQDHHHRRYVADRVAEKEREWLQDDDTTGQQALRGQRAHGLLGKSGLRKGIVYDEQRREQNEQRQIDLI